MSIEGGSVEDNLLADEDSEEQETTATATTSNMGWIERLVKLQHYAHILSHILALLAVLLVVWWIRLLGGLSWKTGQASHTFNYHPLFMVIAFAFMTTASLSFRHYTMTTRYYRKLTHAISWSTATICGAVSLVAVFQSHNDVTSGLIANMYSLHSWIGITVVTFYLLQWTIAMYAFYFGNPSWKGLAVSVHKYVGPLLYQGVAVAMLLGIQEKEGFVGCSYKVTEIDSFPAKHYYEIPLACRVSHKLGLVVFVMALSTTFALSDFGRMQGQESHVS